jgi:hypothetical protein
MVLVARPRHRRSPNRMALYLALAFEASELRRGDSRTPLTPYSGRRSSWFPALNVRSHKHRLHNPAIANDVSAAFPLRPEGMSLVPVARNIHAPAEPHGLMAFRILNETLKRGDPAWTTDEPAM